jgi:hypothetical protein
MRRYKNLHGIEKNLMLSLLIPSLSRDEARTPPVPSRREFYRRMNAKVMDRRAKDMVEAGGQA